ATTAPYGCGTWRAAWWCSVSRATPTPSSASPSAPTASRSSRPAASTARPTRCCPSGTPIAARSWARSAPPRTRKSGASPSAPTGAAEPRAAADAAKSATSRIVAVTVYQPNALVTREVDVPEGAGIMELVVTPLPEAANEGHLYSEGTDNIRVLTTRYHNRAV